MYKLQHISSARSMNHVLAQPYSFTDDELDFIINYDIKYRMGRNHSRKSRIYQIQNSSGTIRFGFIGCKRRIL